MSGPLDHHFLRSSQVNPFLSNLGLSNDEGTRACASAYIFVQATLQTTLFPLYFLYIIPQMSRDIVEMPCHCREGRDMSLLAIQCLTFASSLDFFCEDHPLVSMCKSSLSNGNCLVCSSS